MVTIQNQKLEYNVGQRLQSKFSNLLSGFLRVGNEQNRVSNNVLQLVKLDLNQYFPQKEVLVSLTYFM